MKISAGKLSGCYLPPNEAFRRIGQTLDFPEMSRLLRQVWEYKGEGIPAKLFYEGKVAEAVFACL